MHIVENRGSGVKAMLQAMREANLEPPRFTDRRTSFRVAFLNHTLMNPEAIAWLNQFAGRALNDRQRLALVYLRQHGEIHNSIYRRLNRVDPVTAGQELRRLVEADMVDQEGIGRWTSYRLKVPPELQAQRVHQTDVEQILTYVRQHGAITNTECREMLDVTLQRASYLLKKMAAERLLTREGKRRWARYRLP